MVNCVTLGDDTLRVPTFYSPTDASDGAVILIGVCISVVFGAVHCIAWSFYFATLQERWIWRISAVLVSGSPFAISALSFFLTFFNNDTVMSYLIACVTFLMVCLYFISRVVLLVLPFVALRAMLPDAYVGLNWIDFLPHI
jgi:hypothetical protein